jgi:hypothetical protein
LPPRARGRQGPGAASARCRVDAGDARLIGWERGRGRGVRQVAVERGMECTQGSSGGGRNGKREGKVATKAEKGEAELQASAKMRRRYEGSARIRTRKQSRSFPQAARA